MSPCLSCVVFAKDETDRDRTWPAEWNHVCAKCGKEFTQGDRILVVDDSIVYHYDCFDGPKPSFEEALVVLD